MSKRGKAGAHDNGAPQSVAPAEVLTKASRKLRIIRGDLQGNHRPRDGHQREDLAEAPANIW